ncbi:hypothetical protein BDQ12DRAFT_690445 [Crucibulum laeve]|uniref:Uncharacterized protein n=1 Tax=Crucibulum laeve TaxID=68775 RepID=A0A5C3LPL7_9AGAR|nr:hypothetical protein BDQ12DRAFT_690445 [Crucibulum laeve]
MVGHRRSKKHSITSTDPFRGKRESQLDSFLPPLRLCALTQPTSICYTPKSSLSPITCHTILAFTLFTRIPLDTSEGISLAPGLYKPDYKHQ